jgi:RND superfamily putative drug exporter
MLEWLGRATARWRYVILGVWVVVAFAGGVFGAGVFDRTESEEGARGDSARVHERLDELAPDGETVVAVIGGVDFYTPALVASASKVMQELRTLPGVHEVRDAYTAGGLIASDKQSSLAVVELDPKLEDDAALEVADRVAAKLRTIDAPEVIVGGKLLAERTFAEQATRDAVRGDAIAFVVLAVVLVLFGGGLIAGGLPLLAALATITGSLLGLNALASVTAISEFAVNVVTLLGLGLAVDYSLLVIARFREERTAAPEAAISDVLARTMAGAGRAVLGSGLAVAIALAVTAALLALSIPALGLEVADADARSLPADAQARRVLEAIERDFTAGPVDPIQVLIDAGPTQPEVTELIERMRRLPHAKDGMLRDDLPPSVTGIEVDAAGPDSGERAQELVRSIRDLDAPVRVQVGGAAAELVDAKDSTAPRLPLALLVVGLPTALLVFALTRSMLIALKAIVLNLLTLGAALGVVALVLPGPLDITTPLLLFMFLFGLSMDYEVFLLARIKEEWDRTGENDRAVLDGIAASGPVVTAAAISIGVVFGGFARGELAEVREIGVGMTVALLLDVTVVRGLLLPATMTLFGRRNWWPGDFWSAAGRMS